MFTLAELDIPIIAAPMAGGASTPNLVVAASDACGLGFLAGGYKTPQALAAQIVEVRQRTDHAFGVNLFMPQAPLTDRAAVESFRDLLGREYGLSLGQIADADNDWFAEKVALVIAHRVPVVSFTFGLPSDDVLERMHNAGSFLIATVTSVSEARQAEGLGVDALCVQGPESGGHRATFTNKGEPGTLALGELLIAIGEVVTLPLIAAGGIHSGGQIASLLAGGGIAAVQLGTAFLRTDESGANPAHQNALLDPRFTQTVVTRAFSGRPARGLRNAFITAHDAAAPHEYPQVHHLTKVVRADAARRGDPDELALWAGTGFREARTGPAAAVIGALWNDTQLAVVS